MAVYLKQHIFIYSFYYFLFFVRGDNFQESNFKIEDFVFWPNGTIPFYITPEHFDKEQSLIIMSSLANFAFQTCLQFNPVMVKPRDNQHVMVFENPRGVRKCTIGVEGHGREEAHRILVGYDCLKSPNMDMIVMKALGFHFEHNRASRDVFIDVQYENIEPGSISLFTKERKLPVELRMLPYDLDSVLHFGERDYSKNGHRTIIFKNTNSKQNRIGLSKADIRKIEIIYGPECQKRDRLAKIDLCKNYPAQRRKREVDIGAQSLRVNRDITVPPENLTNETEDELGIEDELQNLVEHVHKITLIAIDKTRIKRCNSTKEEPVPTDKNLQSTVDMTKVVETIKDYAKSVIQKLETNLTAFCSPDTRDIEIGRWRCEPQYCPPAYKSTKSGRVKYSTQHRPIIKQSTKHEGKGRKPQYDNNWLRTNNVTDTVTDTVTDVGNNVTDTSRRRRAVSAVNESTDTTNTDINETRAVDVAAGDILRMGTTVSSHKVVNFAPVRRFGRRHSVYGIKDLYKERDDESNLSLEKSKRQKNKQLKPYRETTEQKERYVEKGRSKKVTKGDVEEEMTDEENDRKRHEKRQKMRKQRKRTSVPETVELSQDNKEFYADRMWPNGVVPYIIAENSDFEIQDVRARLEEVNDILKEKTCVRLEEISEKRRRKYEDYLVVDDSADYVTGRVGGRQSFGCVELFEGGQHKQHAAMMVMAMLGFYFEVARHDRDKYIRVHNRHIRADKLHHFEKIRPDATLPLSYDYKSATQPAWQFWRKIGIKGISSVATYKDQDPDGSLMKSLGQNDKKLSDIDIMKINSVYGVKCFQNQRRTQIN